MQLDIIKNRSMLSTGFVMQYSGYSSSLGIYLKKASVMGIATARR